MQKQVANYTVIIEKTKRIGTNKTCYNAYVPVLAIATEATTIEKVQKDIYSLVKFHLESLAEEGEEIPLENDNSPLMTSFSVELPKGAHFSI